MEQLGKIEKLKTLARLSAKQPKSVVKAIGYLGKYGFIGLRERLYQEVVLEDETIPLETGEPGSATGGIKFSILIPVYNVDVRWLSLAVDSVERQVYGNWELCIVDDYSTDDAVALYLQSIQSDRVKVKKLDSNKGISGATNEAAKMATGEYLLLLDNDDELSPNALLEFYLRLSTTQADVIYSDNDVIDEAGNRLSVLYKPDWSPDLLLSQMYVGHLLGFKRSLFEAIGGFRSDYDGSQDYDLLLRLTECSKTIEHVPEVLYSWRALRSSTAANPDSKPYAQVAGLNAIQDHLDRTLGAGKALVEETDNLFVYDVRYRWPQIPKVSIIMPTKDHVEDVRAAVESIFEKTQYPCYEIIILDNNSEMPETIEYLQELRDRHDNVMVEVASYKFNWSKLNNQGIRQASGDVLVCLNNDVIVQSADWLDRLVENCMRPEIGVVGGLLLYPDETIQHAGVVVGMGGWADHVYKGASPVHCGNPFISPMVARNVSAVTGACMAFSRRTFDLVGGFNEDFVVCGSDVEVCLRAERYGLRNLYLPGVRLTHYESKTRDPKDIPDVDYRLSEAMYRKYVAAGDPYYNANLDYFECVPTVLSRRDRLKRTALDSYWVDIPETKPLRFRKAQVERKRINLLIPSVNTEDVYGGIATALKFYKRLVDGLEIDARILVLDAEPRVEDAIARFPDFDFVRMEDDSESSRQIVSAVGRSGRSIPVSAGDWFVCTSWWSAYCVQDEYERMSRNGDVLVSNPLLYLIQDYEPGFYAWSSRYLLADSTYRNTASTIAIFNSRELKSHFDSLGYNFERSFVFDPFLNDTLREHLMELGGRVGKRRQIMVYGRPGTDRNAFALVVETLRRWIELQEDHALWEIVSAGEHHAPVYLGSGRYLTSVGKLSIDGYARLLAESYAGLSFMVSPHPSYPPLEMAAYGVRVITNGYSGKDLSTFGESVVSLPRATPSVAAQALKKICDEFEREVPCGRVRDGYLSDGDAFDFIKDIKDIIFR